MFAIESIKVLQQMKRQTTFAKNGSKRVTGKYDVLEWLVHEIMDMQC